MSLFGGTLFAVALLLLSGCHCELSGFSPSRLFLNKYFANLAQQKEFAEAGGNCLSPIPPPVKIETQTVQNEVITQPVVTETIVQGLTNIALNPARRPSPFTPSRSCHQPEASSYVSDVLQTQISSPVEYEQGEYYPQVHSVSNVPLQTSCNTLPSPNVQEIAQVPITPNQYSTNSLYSQSDLVSPRTRNKPCRNSFVVTPTKPELKKNNNFQASNQLSSVSSSVDRSLTSQCFGTSNKQESQIPNIQVPIVPQMVNNKLSNGNEGNIFPNIVASPQEATQNIQLPLTPKVCNVPTLQETLAYNMTPPKSIENCVPTIQEKPANIQVPIMPKVCNVPNLAKSEPPVNVQIPMMPKVYSVPTAQENQAYMASSQNIKNCKPIQEPINLQVPIISNVSPATVTQSNQEYVKPNIIATPQCNTYFPTQYAQEPQQPVSIQVPIVPSNTVQSVSDYVTPSSTCTPYSYTQESLSPIQIPITPATSTNEAIVQNNAYVLPNVQPQANVYVVSPYNQEQYQAPIRIQIPPIPTTVQTPSSPTYVVTPTVIPQTAVTSVPSYKESCPVEVLSIPQTNPFYTASPQEILFPITPEYYQNFDIATSSVPDLSYLNECCYGNELPLNLNINVPPSEQVIAVISQAAPLQDPGVYQQQPLLPPVIVMENSKSKWKNWLPIMLLALLDRDCGNNGCSSPSYSYIPYPITFPVNNPIICGSGSRNNEDVDDDVGEGEEQDENE